MGRLLIYFFMFGFFSIIIFIGFYLVGRVLKKIDSIFNRKDKTTKKTRTLTKRHPIDDIILKRGKSNVVPDVIDFASSTSITQYGNRVMEVSGELSGYMLSITDGNLIEMAHSELEDIVGWDKGENLTIDASLKSNFLISYLKDRLIKQIKDLETKIYHYESMYSDYDVFIDNAESKINSVNIPNVDDVFEKERYSNIKSNIDMLKNKVLSLKKNKLYHLQGISQLKSILSIHNKLVMELDNVKQQLLPVLDNRMSLDKLGNLDFNLIKKQLKEIDKIKSIKIK